MIDRSELLDLIDLARRRGAVVEVAGDLERIRVSGVSRFGPGWMPPIQAAERLREFLCATQEGER